VGMSDPIRETSVRFQLLVVGTIVFLVVFFSVIFPGPSSESNTPDKDWCIINGLSAMAGYLAFVVLLAGHSLLANQREPRPEADRTDPSSPRGE
jgi:hypothetical protein